MGERQFLFRPCYQERESSSPSKEQRSLETLLETCVPRLETEPTICLPKSRRDRLESFHNSLRSQRSCTSPQGSYRECVWSLLPVQELPFPRPLGKGFHRLDCTYTHGSENRRGG